MDRQPLARSIFPLEAECAAVFPTELGWMAISTRANVLCRLSFGNRSPNEALDDIGQKYHDVEIPQHGFAPALIDRLTRYAAGECVDFRDVEIELSHLSDFGASVIAATRQIPLGTTQSYGQIAALAGRPGAARAVGRMMAKNRTPLVVPCHRVIGSGGRLGGFSASDGLAMKRRLLRLESQSAGLTAEGIATVLTANRCLAKVKKASILPSPD
jgi:methylated-DNA-[protein]-cysteine S-methyltransferase